MSKTAHTPEPWAVFDSPKSNYRCEIVASGPRSVQTLARLPRPGRLVEPEANAARIVACVNACAGMDDPADEIIDLLMIKQRAIWLAGRNAELLAALREARRWIGDGDKSDGQGIPRDGWTDEHVAVVNQVDAALAKALTPSLSAETRSVRDRELRYSAQEGASAVRYDEEHQP